MKKLVCLLLLLGCLLVAPIAWAQGVLVGVNLTNNDGSLSAAFQDEEIKQLAESHVTTIRVGLVSYNTEFIIKAYQHGIGSVVIVLPFLGLKSWSDVVFSKTTPEIFTERIKPMLDKLEAAGVRLTVFELGNEINNSRLMMIFPRWVRDANSDWPISTIRMIRMQAKLLWVTEPIYGLWRP